MKSFDPLATALHMAQTIVSMNADHEFDGLTYDQTWDKAHDRFVQEGNEYRKAHPDALHRFFKKLTH